jgi:predicted MPP superfamily phosphohydrolase
MNGNAVAVPGNHDYMHGHPDRMAPLLESLNIRLLRNESWVHAGITWVGVDSFSAWHADMVAAMEGVTGPAICLWHEPDAVEFLDEGCQLQISGHSHGGQFIFPGGFTPMHTKWGERYVSGFYPDAKTPIYVSRGIGTTGYPSRLNCAPEVSLLTLVPHPRFPEVAEDSEVVELDSGSL